MEISVYIHLLLVKLITHVTVAKGAFPAVSFHKPFSTITIVITEKFSTTDKSSDLKCLDNRGLIVSQLPSGHRVNLY